MKKIISFILALALLVLVSLTYFEPELVKATDDTTAVTLDVTSEITITCDAAVDMATGGPINSISGGTLTGLFDCTVTTPDTSGWNMTIIKDQKLLTGAGGANSQFDDITPAGPPLAYTWTTVSAGAELLGFSLESGTEDPLLKYQDAGVAPCGVAGTATGSHCWGAIPTTGGTAEKVTSSDAPPSTGVVNFQLKAIAGSGNALVPGEYSMTITASATVGE